MTQPLREGLGRPHDGEVTHGRLITAYGLPISCAIVILVSVHPVVTPGALLPGAAIISGVLLSLATMSYNRVKDLGGSEPWEGTDPMWAAVVFARASVAAAQISVVASAGLVVALMIPSCSVAIPYVTALAIGTLLHLFIRIWYLLAMIRHQVGVTAGQRSAGVPR
ncbi:hypothetical protein VC60_gp31 [Mycobacterium phage Sbash]|uniref:Uncharacterized protein n=1 Tax=Mycobacterium phage Sbash TaxID=1567475 RepID=A0A0A7RXT6_9CAUD|nr:hypothetical protein VC60_gp31 [Mycobacterium phage Sbash]AJA43332.1 hypothetical protein PBI_SBASH_31 [Mycobacterium phage Sbash]